MVTRKPACEKQEHELSLHFQVNALISTGLRLGIVRPATEGHTKPLTACSAYGRTEGINPADIMADLRSEPQLQPSHRKTAGSTAAREIVFSPGHWRNVSRCLPE